MPADDVPAITLFYRTLIPCLEKLFGKPGNFYLISDAIVHK